MQDSSLHNRPARVTYAHAPSHSNSRSTAEAQAQRRQLALDAQRQRRTHAFELARRAYEANRGEMGEAGQAIEELSLDSGFMTGATAMVDDGPVAGQYTDADEIEEDRPSGQEDATTQTSDGPNPSAIPKKRANKLAQPRPRQKPRHQPWARNLLSFGETLDLSHGLPEGFADDWRVLVAPKGKRCLCASISDNGAAGNTLLYSRVSGRTLARVSTVLPPDCFLDCVYDENARVLWALDLIKWGAQGFVVECEADFRAFFLSSRLSELPPQANPSPQAAPNASPPQVQLLLSPSLAPPLSPSTLNSFLEPLLTSQTQAQPIPVPVPTFVPGPDGSTIPSIRTVPLSPDGVLCYLKQAGYESGPTALVGWVPLLEVGDEEGQVTGVRRLAELVDEWNRGLMEG